jgi:hypothetical protein
MDFSIIYMAWLHVLAFFMSLKDFVPTITWDDIKQTYSVGKELFQLSVYFLAAVAAIGVLWRLPKIIELVQAFGQNKGQIWDLRNTVQEMKEFVPDITEKLQALQTQVVAIQRDTADSLIQSQSVESSSASDDDWESIKKMWTDARDRLEKIIEQADGRRARKYEKLARYNYTDVIKNLLADGFIDISIAVDARYMNDEFLLLRNRQRPISQDIKNRFAKRKKRFDDELGRLKPLFHTQSPSPPQDREPPAPPKGNGGTDTAHPPA